MKNHPVISCIASGINTQFWLQLHECLSQNEVNFEIVVTGHIEPNFKLPDNFRYIYSVTKPSQCAEISARNAVGEFIMLIGDDIVFNPGYLDRILEYYKQNCTDKDCASGLFQRNNQLYSIEDYKFWPDVEGSPIMPICQFLKADLWRSLGGADRRFIGVFWDLDLNLRMFENGGKRYVCDTCICEEIYFNKKENIFRKYLNKIIAKLQFFVLKKNVEDGLYREYGMPIDRPLLDSFWTQPSNITLEHEEYYAVKDGYTHLVNRLTPVHPFDDYNILNESQGPKGRWK